MNILNPNKSFDYSRITLGNPTPVQGGSYFTKLKNNDDLLYAQMPKCLTKKGIIRTEKNCYCDLLYERNNEEKLIECIEKIESCCQDLIDKKKHLWFHTELSRDDITTMMSPICRIFRSGKNILIRVNIDKNKQSGQLKCIAYNEEESLVDIDNLTPEQKIIPLICIDGIKFTARSFEICISLRQLMILDKEKDLETINRCMISLDKNRNNTSIESNEILQNSISLGETSNTTRDLNRSNDLNESSQANHLEKKTISCENDNENNSQSLGITSVEHSNNSSLSETVETSLPHSNIPEYRNDDNENREGDVQESVNNSEEKLLTEAEGSIDFSGENNPAVENVSNASSITDTTSNELTEVDLDINASDESIQLKSQNEVYYEIYKDAKEKAKQMREAALKAYLEAEKIKMKFSLENVDDESDFDDSCSECSNDSAQSVESVKMSQNLAEN